MVGKNNRTAINTVHTVTSAAVVLYCIVTSAAVVFIISFHGSIRTSGVHTLSLAVRASSAASAASAAIDHLNCVHCGSGEKWQSMGVLSKGDYGIEKGIYYSVPAICTGDQSYNPVSFLTERQIATTALLHFPWDEWRTDPWQDETTLTVDLIAFFAHRSFESLLTLLVGQVMGIPIDAYSANKMNITEKELLEERDGVKDLLGPFDKIVKTVSVRSLAKGAKT